MLKTLIPATSGILSRIAPRFSGHRAAQLFQRPRRLAIQQHLLPAPDYIVKRDAAHYRVWGQAPSTAVLLHGWEGHHSQFHPLGLALRQAGWRVALIEPPGHRGLAGERSSPVHFANALKDVLDDIGGAELVVGHSMGGLAALLAASQGANIQRLVSISAPSDAASSITTIADWLKIGLRARRHMNQAIEEFAGLPIADVDVEHMNFDWGNRLWIVHDQQDRHVNIRHAERIWRTWPRAHRITTHNLGHSRILCDRQLVEELVNATGASAGTPTTCSQADLASEV